MRVTEWELIIFVFLYFVFNVLSFNALHPVEKIDGEVPMKLHTPEKKLARPVVASVSRGDEEDELRKAENVVIQAKAAEEFAENLDLLSRLIESEGRGESIQCKRYIGSVVLNRVNSDKFPDTLREVIYQPNQFSVVHEINGVVPIERPASQESLSVAIELCEKGSVLPPEVLVFYSSSCDEGWVTSRAVYCTVDNTVFAYLYSK